MEYRACIESLEVNDWRCLYGRCDTALAAVVQLSWNAFATQICNDIENIRNLLRLLYCVSKTEPLIHFQMAQKMRSNINILSIKAPYKYT